jgi:putative DNA primase/helicase
VGESSRETGVNEQRSCELRAADIHSRIGDAWPAILERLGIAESFLRLKKAGPCPACSGHDRYVFDNRRGHGDFFCRRCGNGDGFALLIRVFGWSFAETRRRVIEAAGLNPAESTAPRFDPQPGVHTVGNPPAISRPPARLLSILRSRCPIVDCADAMDYLDSRGLWPVPVGCTLRAHASLEYWEPPGQIGRYSGLVAEVRDIDGDLVAAHFTYLKEGRKIPGDHPRKQLGKVEGRIGCAARLMPATDPTLAIAEGIETALSAAILLKMPVWAALNTSLLARFEPPPGITALVICADRDEAGLLAAAQLMQRLQGRVRVELKLPTAPLKDFNDQLVRSRNQGGTHV